MAASLEGPRAPRLLGDLHRWREHQLAVALVDLDRLAVANLTTQKCVGKWILQIFLHRPLERPGAIDRVVADPAQPGASAFAEIEADLAVREQAPEPDKLAEALKPELLKVFPAALLGRLVVIPYYPLTDDDMGRIVKLQLGRITRRMKEQHDADFRYTDEVVAEIVRRCNDPASGGRMVDNIITNTMLPAISLEILNRSLIGQEINAADVGVVDREFTYAVH